MEFIMRVVHTRIVLAVNWKAKEYLKSISVKKSVCPYVLWCVPKCPSHTSAFHHVNNSKHIIKMVLQVRRSDINVPKISTEKFEFSIERDFYILSLSCTYPLLTLIESMGRICEAGTLVKRKSLKSLWIKNTFEILSNFKWES